MGTFDTYRHLPVDEDDHYVISDDGGEFEDSDETLTTDVQGISDDGGEFEDSDETLTTDVQGNIDERRAHYRAIGRRVVIDFPPGRDWR